MHEISMVQSVIDAMKSEVERRGLQEVSRLHIRIGKLKAVEPESFRLHFDSLSKGTALEGAALDFDVVEPRARCPSCEGVFEIAEVELVCPDCGNETLDVIAGDELLIDEYEAT